MISMDAMGKKRRRMPIRLTMEYSPVVEFDPLPLTRSISRNPLTPSKPLYPRLTRPNSAAHARNQYNVFLRLNRNGRARGSAIWGRTVMIASPNPDIQSFFWIVPIKSRTAPSNKKELFCPMIKLLYAGKKKTTPARKITNTFREKLVFKNRKSRQVAINKARKLMNSQRTREVRKSAVRLRFARGTMNGGFRKMRTSSG